MDHPSSSVAAAVSATAVDAGNNGCGNDSRLWIILLLAAVVVSATDADAAMAVDADAVTT